MRRLLAIALPAVLLLGAPVATAKQVSGAKVCGADGCRSIPGADESLLMGGDPTSGPTAPEPFVRLEMRLRVPGHSERVRNLFLPRSGLVLADDGVTWTRPVALAELRAQARRVTPLAPSELPADALEAPAEPAPAAPAAPDEEAGGLAAGWLVLAAGALMLAAGVTLARRRRRDGPARAAGAAS